MKFKKLLVNIFFWLCIINLQSQTIRLVESVPIETVMEQSALPLAKDVWVEMFSSAEKSIDIEVFYFTNQSGEPMEKVMNSIKDAAARGVKVRVIVDNNFYTKGEKSVDELEDINGIEIRKIPFNKIGGGVMHAKYFVIDGKEIFVGSQNFDWRALKHIHEMGITVKSEKLASDFEKIFEMDWQLALNPDKILLDSLVKSIIPEVTKSRSIKLSDKKFGDVSLYAGFSPFNATPEAFMKEENELLNMIDEAKDSICIQVINYSLKNKFYDIDNELRAAAERGVKIKILFADWTMKKSTEEDIKSLSKVKNIEIKISTIPEFSGGFIPYARVDHSKYMIVDNNKAMISTSNWEKGYFYDTRDAAIFLTGEKINKSLNEVFERIWNSGLAEYVDINKSYETKKRE
jgi:phosphatidylserine/phosphatidylglycerophosphate/cardiolipin synthase-like enzyme